MIAHTIKSIPNTPLCESENLFLSDLQIAARFSVTRFPRQRKQ